MPHDPSIAAKVQNLDGGNRLCVAPGGTLEVSSGATVSIADGGAFTGKQLRQTAVSESFDLDNGAGATIDRVILRRQHAITIVAARIVYEDATSGTVAAGNARIGTTVGGSEIVASTAYENSKAVGTTTAMTIVSGAVAANTPVCVRHTGVAATQAGRAHVEIEFTIDT